MRTPIGWILFVATILCGLTITAFAEEGSELEQKIDKLRQHVKELVKDGKQDEADRVERDIARLKEQFRESRSKERGDQPQLAEAKQRLVDLKRRLAELREAGRSDEAEDVARQFNQLRERLERAAKDKPDRAEGVSNRELDERLAKIKRRIAELKESGRDDEANRLVQAQEMMQRAKDRMPKEAVERSEKTLPPSMHLFEAAKHLHAAGMHDLADNVMRQAKQVSYTEGPPKAREADHPKVDGQAARVEELSRAMRSMHEQLERMEKQLQELREQHDHR